MPIHSIFDLKQTYNYMYFRTRFIILNPISKRWQEIMFAQRPDSRSEANIEYFSYNFYTCTNPFIHLLGSSLIQWIIVTINGREELKHNLQVRLGEALLRLRLGEPESSKNLTLGSPRQRCLCLVFVGSR